MIMPVLQDIILEHAIFLNMGEIDAVLVVTATISFSCGYLMYEKKIHTRAGGVYG
jgi:hypothetical protein